jgi:hypothetical protein
LKAKEIVSNIHAKLHADKDVGNILLEYKELEIARGFLGHLSVTFEVMVPYFKGFHLTLAAHLYQRDDEG